MRNCPLLSFGVPIAPRVLGVGGPTHPNFGMMVGLSSALDMFVFIFRQSAPVQKYGGVKTTGVEIWAKISDILLPCKKGGNRCLSIFYD